MLSLEDLGESLDGVLEADKLSWGAGEDLSDVERLGHEFLDFTGAGDGQLVVLGELVHTEDGDDVLESLVVLEELLDLTGDLVVGVTDNTGVHHTGSGVEGVDGGVDAELSNVTGEHSGGIQVSEGGGRGGVGKIVGRDVDGLDGGDGSLGSGGNTLLEPSHVSGKGGLVSDSGRDTSKKGRHFGSGLGKAEDVVNEEKHILSLLVTEVLGDGESGKGDTCAGSWGLVHLSVHEGGLGLSSDGLSLLVDDDDASLNHFVVEIVTLTGALSDTGKDRVSSVVHGDVVDELHDNDGLSNSGSSEESDLSSLGIGGKKVDDLDAGGKDLLGLTLLDEGGGGPMEGSEELLSLGVDGSLLVDGLSDDIKDASKGLGSDRDLNGGSGIDGLLSADKSFGGLHCNGAHGVLSKVLGNLKDEAGLSTGDLEGVENLGETLVELDVDDGTDHLGDPTGGINSSGGVESTAGD